MAVEEWNYPCAGAPARTLRASGRHSADTPELCQEALIGRWDVDGTRLLGVAGFVVVQKRMWSGRPGLGRRHPEIAAGIEVG
jgi:hypothetical protein